jgi:hypothetical protein
VSQRRNSAATTPSLGSALFETHAALDRDPAAWVPLSCVVKLEITSRKAAPCPELRSSEAVAQSLSEAVWWEKRAEIRSISRSRPILSRLAST